jgi:hypothetical protein
MNTEDKEIRRMINAGIFPYINCDVWQKIQRYYFVMIKHEERWLEETSSFSTYVEWLNFKFIPFFPDINEVKNHPDFNKFIGSYIDEQIRITEDATKTDAQYGIEADSWFYEPREHAKKTKMFLNYIR